MDTQYQCKYSVESSRDQYDDYLSPFNEHNFHSEETDWDAIIRKLDSIDWDAVLPSNPQEMLNKIYSIVYEGIKDHVPKRKSKTGRKNNIPRERQNLMRRQRQINKLLINVTSQKRIENLRSELIRIELALQKSLNDQVSTEEHKAMKAIKCNSK